MNNRYSCIINKIGKLSNLHLHTHSICTCAAFVANVFASLVVNIFQAFSACSIFLSGTFRFRVEDHCFILTVKLNHVSSKKAFELFLIYCGEYGLTAQWSSPLFLWSAAVILFLSTTSLLQELLLQDVNAADEIIPHEQTSPYEFLHTGTKNLTSRSSPQQSHPLPHKPSLLSTHAPDKHSPLTTSMDTFRHLYAIPLRASSTVPMALGELHKNHGMPLLHRKPSRSAQKCSPHDWWNVTYHCFEIQMKRQVSNADNDIWSYVASCASRCMSKEDPNSVLLLWTTCTLSTFTIRTCYVPDNALIYDTMQHELWPQYQIVPQEILTNDGKIWWNSIPLRIRRKGILWPLTDWTLEAVTGCGKFHSLVCGWDYSLVCQTASVTPSSLHDVLHAFTNGLVHLCSVIPTKNFKIELVINGYINME